MGKVYRARDLTLERVVALKTLARELSADPVSVQRFLKEARAAARLNHPNIVQIYDFGCVDGIFYLAMEFVDGQSLGSTSARPLHRGGGSRSSGRPAARCRSRTPTGSSTATSSPTT